MKNFCIFCGKNLVDGTCSCAEYISYYGASASAPAPAPAPEPAPTPTPAPEPKPASKPMDSHFQSAGDL